MKYEYITEDGKTITLDTLADAIKQIRNPVSHAIAEGRPPTMEEVAEVIKQKNKGK